MDFNNLVFLDTETSGLGEFDRVCQVGYDFRGIEHSQYFNPGKEFASAASAASHITLDDVKHCPDFNDSYMKKHIQSLCDINAIFVCHNMNFDAGMLLKEGLKLPQKICTQKVVKNLEKLEHKYSAVNLQYLRYKIKLDVKAQAHEAIGDVRVLKALFIYLIDEVKSFYPDEDPIEKMIEITNG